MKTIICLLATIGVCNATFLSLLGDKEDISHAGSYSAHNHGHSHNFYHQSQGFGNSPQFIKVILHQGPSAGYASTGGYSYAPGHSYGHGKEAQIYKVISQNSAAPARPVHVDHGYSASTYPSYAAAGFDSFTSQFNAILPQILQLILADNGGRNGHGGYIYGAGSDVSSRLAAHFGNSGIAYIKRSNGQGNGYYSGGHVIEKGVLEIRPVEGAPVHPPPAHIYSPHGPPVHGW